MTTLFLALLACSGEDGNGDTEPCAAVDLTFVTYNAGLARGFVPGADSRQADIAAALAVGSKQRIRQAICVARDAFMILKSSFTL